MNVVEKIKVSIVGASGYAGGELLRLLLNHPNVEINQLTCQQNQGKRVSMIHPNLRKRFEGVFVDKSELSETDFLFLATPHGIMNKELPQYQKLAKKIVDLSADYRLNNADDYKKWYKFEHANPELLKESVYGIPELHREEIKKASLVAGPGCGATTMIFSLWPLREFTEKAIIDLKVGSSASGAAFSMASHHPERTNAVRPYSPFLHRHSAEAEQETGIKVDVTAHAIQMVRGILGTTHLTLKEKLSEKDVWQKFREAYSDEQFVRIVKDREGVYRLPEPKIVAGTNFVDIGFTIDPRSGRVIVFTAIDNLCRGSAGQGIQSMNLMMGFEESLGLNDLGLHPV